MSGEQDPTLLGAPTGVEPPPDESQTLVHAARPTGAFAAPPRPTGSYGPPPAKGSFGPPAAPASPAQTQADSATVLEPTPGTGRGASAPGRDLLEAAPGTLIGGHEVVRTLGRGGMGIVYLARDPRLQRQVALKVLPMTAATDEQAVVRFRREAEALAALDHPGIRPVHGWGRDLEARVFWLAMGFVDGRPYDAVVEQDAGLGHEPPRRAARVVRDAARALAFAHRRGVIHRDVKPSNLMLEQAPAEDGGLKVHVVDFGLARLATSEALTVEGQVMGTLKFMPPEQALGAEASALSDVYSLGATLFWALTGEGPYDVKRIENLQLKLARGDDPRRPSALRRDVPADLEAIALKALEVEPTARYATADALADDLGRWLEGEPVGARPPGPWRRLRGWARERRAVLVPVAVGVLVLAGALGVGAATRKDQELEDLRVHVRGLAAQPMTSDTALDALGTARRGYASVASRDAWRRSTPAERQDVEQRRAALEAALGERAATDRAGLEAAVRAWAAAGVAAEAGPRDTARVLAARVWEGWSGLAGVPGQQDLLRLADAVRQLAEGHLGPRLEGLDLVTAGGEVGPALSIPPWGVLRARADARQHVLAAARVLDPTSALTVDAPLPPRRDDHLFTGMVALAGPDGRAFLLDAAPVSRSAYREFVLRAWTSDCWSAEGRAWRDSNPTPPAVAEGDGPVTGVTLFEAEAFARASHRRLPTRAERLLAAGGAGWTAPPDPCGLGLEAALADLEGHPRLREWCLDRDGPATCGAGRVPAAARPLAVASDLGFRCAADDPQGPHDGGR